MSTYTVPNVIATHPRGDRVLDVYSHLLTERIVYLGTAIDSGVANVLIAQLLHLGAENSERDIQLYINCDGGDPSAMLAVFDTMEHVHSEVATTCVGQAIGVGAALLAAGAPGKRLILPHARVVLHQPAGQGRGAIPDLIIQADELVRVRDQVEELLASHTGQPASRLRVDTDRDRVFSAAEAVAYGLVDEVIEPRRNRRPDYAARASA